MAKRRMPREARRKVWLDRMEWMAFCACIAGGGVALWLFILLVA